MIVGEPIYLACLIPVVAGTYLLSPGLPRQVFLLAVSYGYYLTFPPTFFVILLWITTLAYLGALSLDRMAQRTTHCGWLLFIFIAAALLPLAGFKYLPLLASSPHAEGADWQLTMAQIVMPIGISFYTFAAIGYLIDVYLGIGTAARNPLRVALFTGFFPYVTAGPIPRARETLPQLEFASRFTADRAMQGVREILIGVVMKFWIADSLGGPSAAVYANLTTATPLEKLVATLFFAFQLYTDFAGYSLIAIGSARLLGVDLPDNFRQPYLSQSLAEFWSCWHISLLTWLRDYFYNPLILPWRRHSRIAVPVATFLTLVAVGIWHGAGWGFLVFGAVHGLLLASGNATKPARERLAGALLIPPAVLVPIRVIITFAIVALSLVFIRAQTVNQAIAVYRDIFSVRLLDNLKSLLFGPATGSFTYLPFQDNLVNISLIVIVIIGDILARTKFQIARMPALVQGSLYATCVLTALYQVISSGAPKLFVYFQF